MNRSITYTLQGTLSAHKEGCRGRIPLPGDLGVSPESFSLLCSPPQEASYEQMSEKVVDEQAVAC